MADLPELYIIGALVAAVIVLLIYNSILVRRNREYLNRQTKWEQSASIDPLTLPGRYTSKFDLSTAGGASTTRSVTRALGYIEMTPLISQRVVNETAQALSEIEQRYPPP